MKTKINKFIVETIYTGLTQYGTDFGREFFIDVKNTYTNKMQHGTLTFSFFPKEVIGDMIKQRNYTTQAVFTVLTVIMRNNLIPTNTVGLQFLNEFRHKLFQYVPHFFITSRNLNTNLFSLQAKYCPSRIRLNLKWDLMLKLTNQQEIQTILNKAKARVNDVLFLKITQIRALLAAIKKIAPNQLISVEYNNTGRTPQQYFDFGNYFASWLIKFDSVDLDTVEAIFNSIDPKHPENYEQCCNKYTECEVEL